MSTGGNLKISIHNFRRNFWLNYRIIVKAVFIKGVEYEKRIRTAAWLVLFAGHAYSRSVLTLTLHFFRLRSPVERTINH